MTGDQIFLFSLFGALFAFLVWGRVRYDLVAFTALLIAVFAGHVEPDAAFAGFGHPAVVIIALVLIVSRGLVNSGAVELIAQFVVKPDRALPVHISIMSVAGAALSAVINNVAALALLMSLDMDVAAKAKRAVSLSLMPLSFATILGGMITLIGTPPNIVIAQYRADALGAPFSMFDFAPVGLVVASIGIAYVALIGWRLIPAREQRASIEGDAGLYVAEARVKEGSRSIGAMVRDLYPDAADKDIQILGLVRRGKRLPGFSRTQELRKGDFLVLEGDPKSIESFMGAAELDFSGSEKHGGLRGANLTLIEAIVPDGARIVGRTAMDVRLLYRHGVTLLGVSRRGKRFRDRVRKLTIEPGDVLLLLGPDDRMEQTAHWLGVYPLADRKTSVIQRRKAAAAIAAFAGAIALAVMGVTSLAIALGACVVAYVALGLLGGEDFYSLIEWKVIVLLASLIPLSAALEASGGTELIANLIVANGDGWPAWVILLVLMVVTMTMSDFLNNVATALIAAPIGVSVAGSIGASPDPFLMGVAVAASCAFLTPIGHKNNTIIMGPGGYQFGDYWRMGLLLEVIVIAVAVPTILWVWPL
ncbi:MULTISPECIES: SLC13 family permease [unclassified Roseitalea]|uniref:SLC13 family permease n=1 Tax=unclassified Roseitalea TaxID=2639107 RepID=UPI00273D0550|nr:MULTISPECIES: SLC13 family permease [unclassified Roseitalea]